MPLLSIQISLHTLWDFIIDPFFKYLFRFYFIALFSTSLRLQNNFLSPNKAYNDVFKFEADCVQLVVPFAT